MTCEFENMDREIKTQIVQNCLSHKLRMKALQNPDLTFTQLMEMSKSQADNIEGEQDVNKLSKERNTRPISKPNKDGGHVDRKSSRSKLRNRNIAPGESLRMENLAVGVANKTIFKRYVDPKILTREMTPKIEKWDVQNLAYDNSSFEKSNDIDYTFPVNTNGKMKSQPMFQVIVHDTPLTIMSDSGASVNVLDEKGYQLLTKPPTLQQTKVKIHAYKSSEFLKDLGKFTTVLKFKSTCVIDKIYIVQGSGGSLLSWKTSQELGLLKAVHHVHDGRSIRVEELVKKV